MTQPELKPLVLLGCSVIDSDHQAFLELITAMRASDNVAFPTLFRSMHAHIAEHFEREDALMTEYASATAREHRAEHERVLGECRQFAQRVERGFVDFGRAFVMERLMPWFDVHITTMDSALAADIAARTSKRA